MNFPHGVIVTVVSTTTTDDGLGNTTTETVESEWGPCAIAPRYATESADPRVPPVVVGEIIYGPIRPLDSDDALVVGDRRYEVDGLPAEWRSPFSGWEPGMEVPVKRTAGV